MYDKIKVPREYGCHYQKPTNLRIGNLINRWC